MGVNAEGKISLSVELQNFKNIASDLKKGLSAQLKQVPLDIEFNNKDLEKKAAEAIRNINEILSKSRVKNLDLSSILPNFVSEINKEGISDEIRMQMIKGFESALTNLRDIGIKQDYSKLKGFSGEDLKAYIADLNDVMDILKTIQGLTERQKQGILTTVLPSLSDLSGRGKDAAKKEYTKGAKKLDAILQLSGDYNGVLQYGVNPTATLTALNELNKKAKSGKELNKNEKQDLLGYLLRGKYLGLEFGKAEDENLKDLDYEGLLKIAKEKLDKATIEYIENKSVEYFAALDKIYNSSAQEITYSDLTKGIKNTTNQKMQSMYDTEAPENPLTRIRAGNVTKRVIKLSSKEKPELRKRTQNEYKKDTGRTKLHSEEELKDFEFDNEEKSIEEIEEKIQEIENKLSQVRDKIAKSKDDQAQLEEQVTNQEKIFEEKDTAYTTYKSKYEKYSSFAKNAKYESEALKGTIANLDGRLEEEKQNKEKIESKYNQLIKKREEIKKEIEEKEKQLEAILPPIQKQEEEFEKQLTDLTNQKKEKQKVVKDREAYNKEVMPIQDEWLEWCDEALQKEYKFEGAKAKSEAFDALKRLGNEYLQFRRNPELSTAIDKEAESARFAVKHYKLWQAAKEAGVAESRLDREKFDTDDDLAYQQAVEYLQKQRENTEQRRENLKAELEKAKAEVTKIQEDIDEVKKQQEDLQKEKSKLLHELRAKPANKEDENEAKIRREQSQLESSNSKIQKLETSKVEAENRLNKLEEYLQKNELTEERKTKYDNRLEELKKERDTQEKILEQKKNSLQTTISEQKQLVQLEQELQESQNALIQEQKETKARQEELDRQEEERRKKAEEERKKQEEANRKQQGNKTETDSGTKTTTEEAQNSGAGSAATSTTVDTATSIPPEKLREILTLLGNIQKALGTLDDGSDIPSITQSVKSMADALKELSVALGEIKQKDFNLNIGLPNNNPIGQQGEAKRKILKELEKQYSELDSYFINKYGDDSSAFNALSKLEGGSNYVKTMMSDFSIIGDINAPLTDKINVYKTLIEQLRSFVIQEGGDLNKIVSNTLSPDKIIEQINQDISNANPATAITKLFEKMQISIDASLAQINTESQGFKFLSGSAEEAAEAKRKFVEANKDVLQSIVASMPKIEEEAKALEKVEEIKEESNKTSEAFEKDESNIEKQKKQAEEIARKKREVQEQYENQFHAWDENGQLSFLDKNDYDLQNEYLELQKQEAEQLAKQAEQNPPKVNIPIEGQISFTNEEDINKIANEVYENSFIANKDGQYSLFRNVEAASNWGQELKEDLQEASKTDFSNLKNQLSLKDWEIAIDKRDKGIEEQFKKINNSKSFLQNTDIPNDFLKKYENISTKNGEGYKATSNLRELKNLSDELANVKTKLKVSFDEAGNLKSTADPLQVQELLKRYDELVEKIQKIKLLIESPDSKEFKLLKDIKETEAEAEKLTSILEKTYTKLSTPEKFLTDTEKFLNPFAEANIPMTESIEQLIDSVGRMKDINSELTSSFDSKGKLIGDPQKVQDLITEYNNLSKVVDDLKLKISSPTSKENIALNLAKDAEKAEKELDNLKNKVDNFFAVRKKDTVESTVQSAIRDYGAINENGELRPIESPFFNDNKDLIQQQQYVISLSKALDEYRIAVDNLKKTRESDNIKLDDLKEANKQVELLENKINELDKAIKKIGKGNTNATDNQINGLKTKIQNILDKNTSLSTDATDKLKGYLDILNSGASISKSAYDSMSADIKQFSAEQTKSLTIWDLMTMKMREGIAFLATKFSLYQIFNQFRQGIEVIHQFDDALTEMMKVSDETRKTLEDYQKTTFDTADAIGTSALQLQNSTADFMRLGMGTNVLCSAV